MSDLGVESISGFKMVILSIKPSKFDKKQNLLLLALIMHIALFSTCMEPTCDSFHVDVSQIEFSIYRAINSIYRVVNSIYIKFIKNKNNNANGASGASILS